MPENPAARENPHHRAAPGPAPGTPGFRLLFLTPEIPGNTGNAIRLAAITGAQLHLVEPLGFGFEDAHLRRAGLDYHDLAVVTVHPDLDAAFEALGPGRVIAFTARGRVRHDAVQYRADDILLFGRESTGLPPEALAHPRVTETAALPMQPSRRSLNLANAASIALYEAWRQHGFAGAQPVDADSLH
ncbi:tRNA (cytidine(34)-2'-O)-methyltransferase [Micrococcus flavus]|uniref:Putative tRNA (cytidine(34)-2'-O)-methyltransferase n=1 Tax=Micrococcus flavus TaxID=384602 RepID=A0A4Y8X250_9MICC|nr:tRNA (cytidine/uridine-2'-O-)-methyltransferase [Micrococcus flavus]TFI03445.1 tRNA (cytidine(34)-2'-O)-methyltransferase [Micrococcus flavus]GGK49116.1 putative tRNA (cytidine(34)-2'-O)-methyltransferase [Micrococcus flavus]